MNRFLEFTRICQNPSLDFDLRSIYERGDS
jgi:hypothetical protein